MKEQINTDMGIVDILVNNAGFLPRSSSQDDDPDNVRRMIDVNVLAHFWVISAIPKNFFSIFFAAELILEIKFKLQILDDTHIHR